MVMSRMCGRTKQPLSVVAVGGGGKREGALTGTAEAAGWCYYYIRGNVRMQCLFPGDVLRHREKSGQTLSYGPAAEQLSTDCESKIAPDCCHFLTNQSIMASDITLRATMRQ
jgi:hypothetical protein